MEYTDFTSCIKILHDEYTKQYGKRSAQVAWERLKDCSPRAMFKAVDQCILKSPSYLPEMDKVINATLAIDQEAKKQEFLKSENDSAQDKKNMVIQTQKAFASESEIARDTLTVIRALQCGKLTRKQFIEGVRHLDLKYPRAGFALQGSKLMDYYRNYGKDIERVAGNSLF